MSKQPQEIEVSSFITFNHLQFISLLSACIFPFLIHLKTSRRINKLFTFCYWLLLWVNLMTGSLLALPAVMCVCVCVLLAVDTALIIRHAAQRLCTVHWALQLKPASVHCKANNAASVHQSRNQALIRWLLSVHVSVGVCVRVCVSVCVCVNVIQKPKPENQCSRLTITIRSTSAKREQKKSRHKGVGHNHLTRDCIYKCVCVCVVGCVGMCAAQIYFKWARHSVAELRTIQGQDGLDCHR